MKHYLTLTLIALLLVFQTNAQEALAKIEFAAAETEYQSGNHQESLAHLETVKEMLGSTNSTVMYLEIINHDKIYEFETSGGGEIERLSKLTGQEPETLLKN
jgi:hypothetical protein